MKYKITFYTTCMGRLKHLRETLPKNFIDNSNYENLEFVILDYNSKDGLSEWIRENFLNEIASGQLVYIKAIEPEYFHMSHAKNLAIKCSSGDIVCNVDADNFVFKGFAEYINEKFSFQKNIFLNTNISRSKKDVCGRIAAYKSDIITIGGYNENIVGWGYDDLDLSNHLINLGRDQVNIDEKYLGYIPHTDLDRIANERFSNMVEEVWLSRSQSRELGIYYFTNREDFLYGFLHTSDLPDKAFSWDLVDEWIPGKLHRDSQNGQVILLDTFGDLHATFNVRDTDFVNVKTNSKFFKVIDHQLLNSIKHVYSIVSNKRISSNSVRGLKNPLTTNNTKIIKNFSNIVSRI